MQGDGWLDGLRCRKSEGLVGFMVQLQGLSLGARVGWPSNVW